MEHQILTSTSGRRTCATPGVPIQTARKSVDRQCHISHIKLHILKDPQIRYQLIKHIKKQPNLSLITKQLKRSPWLGICWDVIKPSNLPSHGWRRCAATRRYALRAPAAGMGKLLGGFE